MVSAELAFLVIMDGHFSDLLHLLKNGQKKRLISAHFEQHFNATTSHTDLQKYITYKLVNKINLIFAINIFTELNCNQCMEECSTILKYLCEKSVTVMNKNS